nr:unnamed protein product [Haemonchus contortus]
MPYLVTANVRSSAIRRRPTESNAWHIEETKLVGIEELTQGIYNELLLPNTQHFPFVLEVDFRHTETRKQLDYMSQAELLEIANPWVHYQMVTDVS